MTFLLLLTALAHGGACDTDLLAATGSQLMTVPLAERAGPAAEVLGSACALPYVLKRAVRQLPGLPENFMGQVDAKAVGDDPKRWAAACVGGANVLSEAFGERPNLARERIWKGCVVERYGFSDQVGFTQATGATQLSILLAHWLDEQGVSREVAKPLLRAVAGIGESEPLILGTQADLEQGSRPFTGPQ